LLPRRESCRSCSRNVDRLARRRVTAFARGALADAELAEAGDRDVTPGRKLVTDDIECRLDRCSRLTLSETRPSRDIGRYFPLAKSHYLTS